MEGIVGRKIGMSRIFNEEGQCIPVTVIEAGPCPVVQIKTVAQDGYDSVQLGFGEKRENLFTQPLLGQFAKAKLAPRRILKRSAQNTSEIQSRGLMSYAVVCV